MSVLSIEFTTIQATTKSDHLVHKILHYRKSMYIFAVNIWSIIYLMNRVSSFSGRTDCGLEVPDSIPTKISKQGRRQRVQAPSKKVYAPPPLPRRGRPAQILDAKSAILTLSCTVSCAWSERFDLCSRQMVLPPRNTEHMQHSRAPSRLSDGRAAGVCTCLPPSDGTVRNALFIASTLARSPIILRIPKVILLK